MNDLGLLLGLIAGGIIAFIGFLLGMYAESLIHKPKPIGATPQITEPIIVKPNHKKRIRKPIREFGGVNRPTPEDIEKKENPRLEEEEEAWEEIAEGIGIPDETVMKQSAAAVFNHPNNNLLI